MPDRVDTPDPDREARIAAAMAALREQTDALNATTEGR